MAKIHGKQLRENSTSLDILNGSGKVTLVGTQSYIESGYLLQDYLNLPNTSKVLVDKEYVDHVSSEGLSKLSVKDDNTGEEFYNIENIIFKGNTVTVPGGTANGSLVAPGATSTSVVVWIPAPTYVDNFDSSDISTTNRIISTPASGSFFYGDWLGGEIHTTVNTDTITYTSNGEFGCVDSSTILTAKIEYFSDNSSATSNIYIEYNAVVDGNKTNGGSINVNITNFGDDNDRKKAEAEFVFNLSNLLPTSGRFNIVLSHNNNGDIYEFRQDGLFYDADGTSSSATVGNSALSENTSAIKFRSGVSFYDSGSTFDASVDNMDNMNEYTYPLDSGNRQLKLDFTNLAISNTPSFHSDDFTGWSTNDNVQDLSINETYSINVDNRNIPGFENNNNNLLDTSVNSFFTGKIYDWGEVATSQSPDYPYLIDTTVVANSDYDRDTEEFTTEVKRLSVSTISADGSGGNVSGVTSAEVTDSFTKSTNGIQDDLSGTNELQTLFNRLIYPQHDFTSFLPTNTVDYSSLTSADLSFNLGQTLGNSGVEPTFAPTTVSGFRWYCRKFDTSAPETTVSNGVIEFGGNFEEEDLPRYWNGLIDDYVNGNDDLRFYISVDGKVWWDMSRDTTTSPQGPRSQGGSYNLDDNGKMRYSYLSAPYHSSNTCYMLIGMSDSNRGKNIYIDSIQMTDQSGSGNWG